MFATVQRQMIAWTSALAVGLGALTLSSMLRPPPNLKPNGKPVEAPSLTLANANTNGATQPADRGPASIAPDTLAIASIPLDEKNTAQAVELTLPCPSVSDDDSEAADPVMNHTFGPAVKQIKLNGQACGQQLNLASTEILNEANGFSATVFHPNEKSFTTDYISLAPGQNRIRIVKIGKDGHREETAFLVNRQ